MMSVEEMSGGPGKLRSNCVGGVGVGVCVCIMVWACVGYVCAWCGHVWCVCVRYTGIKSV